MEPALSSASIVRYFSGRRGSGNNVVWHETLGKDPARAPTVIDVMTSLKVTFADITSQLAKDASPRRR